MGFDIYSARGVLKFEGSRYHGAEVVIRLDAPESEWASFLETKGPDEGRWMVEHAIESWNLQVGSQPIPVTVDAFNELPRPLRSTIIRAYVRAVAEVDAPLDPPSPASATSAGQSTKPARRSGSPRK